MATEILRATDISVAYGGTSVLRSVALEIRTGQIVGLIGANGAGKTTLIDALSGLVKCAGEIVLNGKSIGGMSPTSRAELGLGRTFQNDRLFDDLTVLANLLAGRSASKWWWPLRDLVTTARRRDAQAFSEGWSGDTLGLEPVFERYPRELSHGQRKMVGLGRTVARDPLVALLDEPGAGLDSTETEVLAEQLRTLCDRGISMLLVDHDMSLVLSVCDYLYVLDFGEVIAQGDPQTVCRHPRVVEAYLGRSEEVAAT